VRNLRRTLAAASTVLVLAAVAGYFAAVLYLPGWMPSLRNHAMPNWLLVAAGLALSIAAVRRAGPGVWAARLAFGLNTALAGLFAIFLYVLLAVPQADGPAVGTVAPDWTLPDQHGRLVTLADFSGAPLLLVFYRGHW
jgi:hypothetical protein